MNLKALTDGSVTSDGTISVPNYLLGGVLITADGTNDAVVTVQKDNSSGKTLFEISTKSPVFIIAPIDTEGTQTCYYSINGTGAAAQFYAWNQ